MAELTVDRTYGEALYQAAVEAGKADAILEEGFAILDIMEQEPDLERLIVNPTIPAQVKKEILGNIFEGKIQEELLNLLYILVDRGRARHYEKIMKAYRLRCEKEEGYSYGTIYSAVKLQDAQLKKFEEQTSNLLRENVKLENEIDASLIGGIKILIDGKVIDASLRKRLEDLGSSIINEKGGEQ